MLLGLLLALLAGFLVVVLFRPEGGAGLLTTLGAMPRPGFLVLALLATTVYLVADALSLGLLLGAVTPGIRKRSTARVSLESNLVAGATSFGGLEIAYQVVLLRRMGAAYSSITSALVVKGLVHASLLVIIALAAFAPQLRVPFAPNQRLLILSVLGALVLFWVGGAAWLRRPLGLCRLPEPVRRRLRSVREAFAALAGAGWRVFSAVLGLQLLAWAALLAVAPLLFVALGWQGAVTPVVARMAVVQFLMPFSPLPGGAGVAELGFLGLVGGLLPPSLRLSALVVWRVLTWLLPMGLGAALLAFRAAGSARQEQRAQALRPSAPVTHLSDVRPCEGRRIPLRPVTPGDRGQSEDRCA
jgi:glycosyltransferase 2 family protein